MSLGTPEMWRSFSERFSDFGLQLPLPASMVEIIDESPQSLGAPQLLPAPAASSLSKLFSWSLFGSKAGGTYSGALAWHLGGRRYSDGKRTRVGTKAD